jgi:hypothetical protein
LVCLLSAGIKVDLARLTAAHSFITRAVGSGFESSLFAGYFPLLYCLCNCFGATANSVAASFLRSDLFRQVLTDIAVQFARVAAEAAETPEFDFDRLSIFTGKGWLDSLLMDTYIHFYLGAFVVLYLLPRYFYYPLLV